MANKPYYGNYKTSLTLTTDKGTSTVSESGSYKEYSSREIVLDNQDGFVKLFELDTETTSTLDYKLSEVNAILIENIGSSGIELQYSLGGFTAGTPDAWDAVHYENTLVPAGGFEYIGNPKRIVYSAATSAASGGTEDNATQGVTPYVESTGVLAASMTATGADTQLTLASNVTEFASEPN